ncbi:MAG: hypothetical protein ABFS32_21845 [Bacteroidota bacterium]
MKKKEKPLVEDFRKFLFTKDGSAELWRDITQVNPKKYLTSDFYTPEQ